MSIRKNSRGMSLVEICIAVLLAALFLVPIVTAVCALRPEFLERQIGISGKEFVGSPIWIDSAFALMHGYNPDDFHPELPLQQIQGRTSCEGFSLKQPAVRLYTALELGVSTTSMATGIVISGEFLAVSFNSSSTTDPDLVTYRMMPDDSLEKVASLDTGPGISDMKASGFSLFLGNTSVNSQMQRMSVEDMTSIRIAGSYAIPGANSMTHPITKKVYVYRDLVIAGAEKNPLPEVSIFDISTGSLLATAETGYGVNGFFALNDRLFVLSPLDPELEIFDLKPALANASSISEGASPHIVQLSRIASYDAPGASGNGRSMDSQGQHAVLGRSKGGDELSLLDLADFGSFKSREAGSSTAVHLVDSKKVSASVDAVIAGTSRVILFSSSRERRIVEYEIQEGGLLSPLHTIPLEGRVSSAACSGKRMFMALQSSSTPIVLLEGQREFSDDE